MRIITRKQAKAEGLTRYFTGRACKRGHVSERFVTYKAGFERKRIRSLVENMTAEQAERERARQRARSMLPKRRAYEVIRRQTPERKAYKALYQTKRAARKRATLAGASPEEIIQIQAHYAAMHFLRRLRFVPPIEVDVDHLIPLSKGGPERLWNIELKTQDANRGPGGKFDSLDEAFERFDFVLVEDR